MSLTQAQVDEGVSKLEYRTKLFINNEFVDAVSGRTFATQNPATGKELAQIAHAQKEDVDKAVAAARASFESGVWSRASPAERKAVLLRWADLIDENRLELALLEVQEAGKAVSETYEGDITEAAVCIRYYAEALDKVYDKVAPTEASVVALIKREPVGVVGVLSVWNFPLWMLGWKVVAIAAGNSVVFKPSEFTSLSCLRAAELARDAGLPAGVFNVVTGFGDAGEAISRHMDVDKVAFTGSTATGKKVLEAAAQSNMKNVSLECGGKSPQVVFADILTQEGLFDTAVENAVAAAFWNSSQNCSCGSRLIIEESIRDQFVAAMQEELKKWPVGDPLKVETRLGAMIHEKHMANVLGFIEGAQKDGARLVCGGKRVHEESGGFFVEPTIFDGVDNSADLAQKEVFGPVLAVVTFKSEDEAVAIANDTQYGLASSLYTSNLSRAHKVAARIRAGTVSVNCFSEGDMTVPFGGYNMSGFVGRDKSLLAFDHYTQLKTIWINLE